MYKCWENSLHTILWNRWAHYGNKEHSIFMCLKSGEAIFSNSFSLFLYFGVIFCFIICTEGHISPHKRYLKLIIKCYNRSFSSFTYFANMVLVSNCMCITLEWASLHDQSHRLNSPNSQYKITTFVAICSLWSCVQYVSCTCTVLGNIL